MQYTRAETFDGKGRPSENGAMAGKVGKVLTIREILDAAARSIPELWDDDDQLNLSAVARYFARKGHPLSQPTIHRHYKAKPGEEPHERSERLVEAFHSVFRIPRSILRGETMAADLEKELLRTPLSTLLLAQKLESLPRRVRMNIENQIEDAFERDEQLKRAIEKGNVTPIDRGRER